MKKLKVLIITYYWPPAGGPGVQRVLSFVKYLGNYGITPSVLTVKKGDYPAYDTSLINQIPEGISIYRAEGWEPYQLYRKFVGLGKNETIPVAVLADKNKLNFRKRLVNKIRTNFFIPDARRFLVATLFKNAKKIISKDNIDLVITSSPPHSLQLVGLRLKKKLSIPWISDFRDPWLSIDYYQNIKRSRFSEYIDRKYEKTVVESSDVLMSVNHAIINELSSNYKINKSLVLYNGFDVKNISNSQKYSMTPKDFTIIYYGNIGFERVCPQFFSALSKLINGKSTQSKPIKVKFIGKIHQKIGQLIKDNDLEANVEVQDYLPHADLMKVVQKADLFLLIINNIPNNKGVITGKLFEYIGLGKPILGIGPVDGEASIILQDTKTGKMFNYGDEIGIMGFINDVMSFEYKYKPGDLSVYTRENQVKILANSISELCVSK